MIACQLNRPESAGPVDVWRRDPGGKRELAVA